MAIKKIEEVYLYYTSETNKTQENFSALDSLNESGISFTKMFYGPGADFEALFTPLNTWWTRPDINLPALTTDNFPFVVYTEVHDDIPARFSPVKYVSGLEAIQNFLTLYNTVNNQ